jgi:uridine kinase
VDIIVGLGGGHSSGQQKLYQQNSSQFNW